MPFFGFGKKKKESQDDGSPVVCENCQKSTQVDLPTSDQEVAAQGNPCGIIYNKVQTCMEENQGQIVPCADVWQEFKICRQNQGVK